MDEGFIQGLSSIAYQDLLKQNISDKLLKIWFKNKKYIIVNCNLKMSQLIKRIKKRNRRLGRIDRFTDTRELLQILKIQNNNLNFIRRKIPNHVKVFDMNMEYSKQDVIDLIYVIINNIRRTY